MAYSVFCTSPLGDIRIAFTDHALTGLWFVGQKTDPGADGFERCEPGHPVASAVQHCLDGYFAGMQPAFAYPLVPSGTAYQKQIWQLLQKIPYGRTVTYGQLAKAYEAAAGVSTSPRAVGGAVSRNPISILIPCHRVLGASGTLTGYAGGLERKMALLRLECAIL